MLPSSEQGDGIGQRTTREAPSHASFGSALPSRHLSRASGMSGPGAQGSTAVPQPGGDTGAARAGSSASAPVRIANRTAARSGGRRGVLSAPRARSSPDVAGSGWLSGGDGASLGSVRPPSGTVWGGLSAGPPRSSGRPSLLSPCVPRRRNVPLRSHGGRSAVPTRPGATGTAFPSRALFPLTGTAGTPPPAVGRRSGATGAGRGAPAEGHGGTARDRGSGGDRGVTEG